MSYRSVVRLAITAALIVAWVMVGLLAAGAFATPSSAVHVGAERLSHGSQARRSDDPPARGRHPQLGTVDRPKADRQRQARAVVPSEGRGLRPEHDRLSGASQSGADDGPAVVVGSFGDRARDPFNGRGSPRHRPALRGAETADGGAPLPASRTVTTERPNPMPAPHPAALDLDGLPDCASCQVPEAGAPIHGWATWYEDPRHPRGLYAAAGPALRRMLGPSWRGSVVIVEGPGRASVTVVLSDWCACGPRHDQPTVLDLSADAFAELAPLGWGVVSVTVAGESGPAVTLPPTYTKEER